MKLFQIVGESGRREARQPRPLRVFVTGATGYLGRAVVRELVAAGHEVTGMTRWAERTLEIGALGARAVVGELRDPVSFERVAAGHDVLIHLAADDAPVREVADRAAVEALLRAARQGERRDDEPPRAVVYTSVCFVVGETGETPADEETAPKHPPAWVAWRPAHERRILEAAGEGIATAVIRPGMVYGGRGGAIGELFASAERDGAAAHVGSGANHWSPVHRADVARLYRLVAERRARGVFHCTEERSAPVALLARAASEAAGGGGATRSVPVEVARKYLGAFADALLLDQRIVSRRAAELGWRPEHPPFLESAESVYREWREG